MEAQTVDTLPPVAADHDPVRCLLAIELSKKSWIVAITTALSDKISRYTLVAMPDIRRSVLAARWRQIADQKNANAPGYLRLVERSLSGHP